MNTKRLLSVVLAVTATLTLSAQTLNVQMGQVRYQVPADEAGFMLFDASEKLTIMEKAYAIMSIDSIFVDNSEVTDNAVSITYDNDKACILVPGKIAHQLTINTKGAHVSIIQDATVSEEIVYTLKGSSTNGSFYMNGELKTTIVLNGVTLHNPDSAAINIRDGKRIAIELAEGTVNTLSDGTGGEQKACFAVKGHTEFKGAGTLNITGNTAHAFWGKEYVELKKTLGTINILGAVGDGFNINQYFEMKGGTLNISGVGDDAIQLSFKTDDDDNIISVNDDEDNTGDVTIEGGTLTITTTGNGVKGIKAANDVDIKGGTININQTGNIVVDGSDVSYTTAIKADNDINISGGSITVVNTAQGGKGLSADGNITIDESDATTVIDIKANGVGGIADVDSSGESETPATSYKVYVSIPTSGGGGGPGGGGNNAWKTVYLYKSDGTLVQQLTNTVTRSNGYSTLTFYYYDFKAADSGTYYFKSDDYSSPWGGTSYTIRSSNFSGPTSGSDVYYSITNSYTTSGSTRTYSLSNVTSTYSGSSDVSEDTGKSYNASGLKADGNITIDAGTITIANSGAMSKSIKSKAAVTINGGTITLKPSGAMQVINSDASYSSGIKAVDFIMNDGKLDITATGAAGRGITVTNLTTNGGTLTITNSGNGQQGSSDSYTAKGLKADTKMALNGGTITISMTGTGGKGIKSSGTYTQGLSDGTGPTLTVSTTGSSFGSSSSGGGAFPGGMGGNTGSSSKGIKVQGTIVIYGGETTVTTKTDGAEGLESKTSIDIRGGKHYFFCYDDCINSAGSIAFNGGATVCYSNGNDAIDSNYGRSGAIVIGNGAVFAYTSKGSPEEGLDCDNNSYIQITGTGIAISAGGAQGGGSSSSTISGAVQGYKFYTTSASFTSGRYYSLLDASGNNLVTFSFQANVSSNLALITAKGMVKNSTYYVKYNTTAPTDATTAFHGLYLGSSHKPTTSVFSFTAQ